MRTPLQFAVALATLLTACGADSSPGPGDELPGGSVTQWTDSTELFFEHPALVVGSPAKFAVHLTDLTDFAPLRSGTVTLRFSPSPGGLPGTVTQTTPRSPGIYGPEVTFDRAGSYDLVILVESPQARDSITVPGMMVYATTAAVPADTAMGEQRIAFLK